MQTDDIRGYAFRISSFINWQVLGLQNIQLQAARWSLIFRKSIGRVELKNFRNWKCWFPPALSIGYQDCNLEACYRNNTWSIWSGGSYNCRAWSYGRFGLKWTNNAWTSWFYGNYRGNTTAFRYVRKKATQEAEGIAYGVYLDPNLYTIFTALPSAGSVIQWFQERHQLTSRRFMALADSAYKRYLAEELPTEAINFVIPHFSGSGSPKKSTQTKDFGMVLRIKLTKRRWYLDCF